MDSKQDPRILRPERLAAHQARIDAAKMYFLEHGGGPANVPDYVDDEQQLLDHIATLEEQLKLIADVYDEGQEFTPETAPEAVLQDVIKKMRDIAKQPLPPKAQASGEVGM